jgi:type 1 fimbria pilin
MNLQGTIKLINNPQKVSDKLTKQQMVLTIDEDTKYPQNIAIEFLNDKTQILQKHKAGEKVSVDINLRGNEYNGKYYNNLVGWKVAQVINNEVTNSQQNPQREAEVDLPF